MIQADSIAKSIVPAVALFSLTLSAAKAVSVSAELLATEDSIGRAPDGLRGTRELAEPGDLRLIPYGLAPRFFATVADDLDEAENALLKMRRLAQRSINSTGTTTSRNVINSEFLERVQELEEIASLSSFGDLSLLDGSEDVLLQGKPPSSIAIELDLPDLLDEAVSLSGVNLRSLTDASDALIEVNRILDFVASARKDVAEARRDIGSSEAQVFIDLHR